MNALDNPGVELLMLLFYLTLIAVCIALGLRTKRWVLWFAFPLTLSFKVILFTILFLNVEPTASDISARMFLSRMGDLSFGTVWMIQTINGRLTKVLDKIVDRIAECLTFN